MIIKIKFIKLINKKMLLQKEKKKPLFEGEYKDIIPSDDEMIFLKYQNQKCYYYYKGMLNCKSAIDN